MITLTEDLLSINVWHSLLDKFEFQDSKRGLTMINKNSILEYVDNIRECQYSWGLPKKSLIPKPNNEGMREIYIYSDRDSVLQKAISSILYQKKSYLVSDEVFSYKKNVRIFTAVNHIIRSGDLTKLYGVKIDISKYFSSVKIEVIRRSIDELFNATEDRKLIHDLFSVNHCMFNNDIIEEYMSLMPGCALSAFFSNYILSDVDRHMVNISTVYARYSDDIVFFCEDRETLNDCIQTFNSMINDLGLTVNMKKVKYFNPGDVITFLGLEIDNGRVDIGKNKKDKIKKFISIETKKSRKLVEMKKTNPSIAMQKCISKINRYLYKSVLRGDSRKGTAYFVFSNVTVIDSLKEIDFYFRDRLKYIKTGKNNFGNLSKTSNEELEQLGWVSLVTMYNLFKMDKDIYANEVGLLR